MNSKEGDFVALIPKGTDEKRVSTAANGNGVTTTTSFALEEPQYSFEDIILSKSIVSALLDVISSFQNYNRIFEDWGLKHRYKNHKNLAVNLYGLPGTGKTMAAHAMVDKLGKKIICVNYANIESKYVGDTSKNLANLFTFATEHDAVIFFDEADAVLSKRVTNMNNATDVSVNQTRSELLYLMNNYNGFLIFATNFITNFDKAFMRRIQFHINFELPTEEDRKALWELYIGDKMPVDVDISKLAQAYGDISGSDISTAVLKVAFRAARENVSIISTEYFASSIESIIQSQLAQEGISMAPFNDCNIKE